jgi:predicted DNA binding CopG/RHH family protein
MTYRELMDKGSDRTEIADFLSKGEMHSTTIRIPDNLRDAATDEARLSGMSFSAYLRMCLIEKLSGKAGDAR